MDTNTLEGKVNRLIINTRKKVDRITKAVMDSKNIRVIDGYFRLVNSFYEENFPEEPKVTPLGELPKDIPSNRFSREYKEFTNILTLKIKEYLETIDDGTYLETKDICKKVFRKEQANYIIGNLLGKRDEIKHYVKKRNQHWIKKGFSNKQILNETVKYINRHRSVQPSAFIEDLNKKDKTITEGRLKDIIENNYELKGWVKQTEDGDGDIYFK